MHLNSLEIIRRNKNSTYSPYEHLCCLVVNGAYKSSLAQLQKNVAGKGDKEA